MVAHDPSGTGTGGSGCGASRVLVGPLIGVLTVCVYVVFEIARDRVAGMGVYSASKSVPMFVLRYLLMVQRTKNPVWPMSDVACARSPRPAPPPAPPRGRADPVSATHVACRYGCSRVIVAEIAV